MDIGEHISALREAGELLAAAAVRTDLETPIPTTPEWRMRDLVRHMGEVHRWAAAHVAQRRTEPIRKAAEVAGPFPNDGELIDWFREGHAGLIRTLETADPDTQCWTFLPAPSPVAFWARRQAHETGIHRADAESPAGSITPFPPGLGSDGVEELLFGFLGRPSRDAAVDPPRSLHLHATDIDGEWMVRLGPNGAETTRGHGQADCAVRASASDLNLLLWNRRRPEEVEVHGDASVLTWWRENIQIYWGRGR
jgi:uncharacterized protein (TIGR03083 family)